MPEANESEDLDQPKADEIAEAIDGLNKALDKLEPLFKQDFPTESAFYEMVRKRSVEVQSEVAGLKKRIRKSVQGDNLVLLMNQAILESEAYGEMVAVESKQDWEVAENLHKAGCGLVKKGINDNS